MIIIKMIAGNTNVNSLLASFPEVLNVDSLGNLTPYGYHFIIAMNSTRYVNLAVRHSQVSFDSKLGYCTISLSSWMSVFDSHALVGGNYQWTNLSNIPLHCWN